MLKKIIFFSLIFNSFLSAQSLKVKDFEKISTQTIYENQKYLSSKYFKVNTKDNNYLNMSKNHTYEEIDIEIGILLYVFTDENYVEYLFKDIFLNNYSLTKESPELLIFKNKNKTITITTEDGAYFVTYFYL
ncbi:hypothetical protein [Empedobacter brevis]|uniref:hypothetical protein n=1 Tax=Empedobacter brevis TaxID=247 RepID=UPI002FDF3458